MCGEGNVGILHIGVVTYLADKMGTAPEGWESKRSADKGPDRETGKETNDVQDTGVEVTVISGALHYGR